jgi:hypothetical protein
LKQKYYTSSKRLRIVYKRERKIFCKSVFTLQHRNSPKSLVHCKNRHRILLTYSEIRLGPTRNESMRLNVFVYYLHRGSALVIS